MLDRESPEDFVIATGITRSLREFTEIVFADAGLAESMQSTSQWLEGGK